MRKDDLVLALQRHAALLRADHCLKSKSCPALLTLEIKTTVGASLDPRPTPDDDPASVDDEPRAIFPVEHAITEPVVASIAAPLYVEEQDVIRDVSQHPESVQSSPVLSVTAALVVHKPSRGKKAAAKRAASAKKSGKRAGTPASISEPDEFSSSPLKRRKITDYFRVSMPSPAPLGSSNSSTT